MRAQNTWNMFVGTLLAGVLFAVAIFGFAEGNPWLGIGAIVLTIAAVAGMVLLYKRAMAQGRTHFDEALDTDFAADDQGWYEASGLAIDRRRRVLLVGTPTGTHRIPFEQIGSSTYSEIRSSPVVAGNSIAALITLPVAISSAVHNASASGLHLTAGGRSFRIVGIGPREAETWQAHFAAARADA